MSNILFSLRLTYTINNVKTKLIFLFFTIIPVLHALAQSELKKKQEIDSRQWSLYAAKQDSAKIALRYYIGIKEAVNRVSYWDSIIADARRHRLPLYECRALIMNGGAYNSRKECARSIECLNQALEIADRMTYKQEKLPLYMYLATAYHELSNISKALDFNHQGQKLAEELNDRKYVVAFKAAKGSYYFSLGEVNKALKMHLECLKMYRQMNYDLGIAGTLLDVGSDYCGLDDCKSAAGYYLASKKYANEFGANKYTVEILNSVGVAYQTYCIYDSAELYFSKGYRMSVAINCKVCITSSLAILASYNYSRGNNKLAIKQTLAALDLAKSLKFTRQIPGLFLTLKKTYEKEGNYKEALGAFELYTAMKDSIANEQTRNQASEKEFAYAFEKKENENKLLAQQNQIQTLQLKKSKYLMFVMGGILALAIILFYLFTIQSRLSAQHQRMHLEQKLLRSQMNPHFIYNSLQAIQNYILSNNARDAVKYLSSFATLTRSVLHNSRMEYIPLTKEIALLENYLQLQKLRFGNRFDYKIHVDDEIDTDHVTIPPMLAQPFIENAIKHGMHDIESGGEIEVSYRIGNQLLLMEIKDNGHGMKQTGSKGQEHQSLAMEITRERIALMNKRKNGKASCTITDAYPLQPDRNGVKVSFSLPLHYAETNLPAEELPKARLWSPINWKQNAESINSR